jgi:hypothetical protein
MISSPAYLKPPPSQSHVPKCDGGHGGNGGHFISETNAIVPPLLCMNQDYIFALKSERLILKTRIIMHNHVHQEQNIPHL